ncbi:transposable element Tc3 transposase [Trichonephila clavipes]|nr:transposable element Tc3 transposase [Trichonephila clavipes]
MKCVYEWSGSFQEVRDSVYANSRNEGPATSVSDENIEKYQNTSGVPLETEIELFRKKHLTPIAFHPISMLSSPLSLGCKDVQELWFQQDGATYHTARSIIDLLKDTVGDRLISRFGPVNCPPRSCDFTPLDYFLWGYIKSLIYADKPQMLDHLEDNIRRVIADIRPQLLEKGIENWTSRLDYIRASRGSPMPEIIFKM